MGKICYFHCALHEKKPIYPPEREIAHVKGIILRIKVGYVQMLYSIPKNRVRNKVIISIVPKSVIL